MDRDVDRLRTVRNLLEKRKWDSVIDAAADLLSDREITLSPRDKAFCYYAQCRALANLDRYLAAIEPGLHAVYLADEANDHDLTGRALLELAVAQFQLKRYQEAAQSWERFLAHRSKCSSEVRTSEVMATNNLAACYRAVGDHTKALALFKAAWQIAAQAHRQESGTGPDRQKTLARQAERARSSAVWEALELGRLHEAENLIPFGEQYVRANPTDERAKSSHLIDMAMLAFLKGDVPTATARAMEAAIHAEKSPELMARAFKVLYDVANLTGDIEAAVYYGLFAIERAEQDERYDMVSEIQECINKLNLKHPDAVLKVVERITSPKEAGTRSEKRGDWHGRRDHM